MYNNNNKVNNIEHFLVFRKEKETRLPVVALSWLGCPKKYS